jgi:hypothetical protein
MYINQNQGSGSRGKNAKEASEQFKEGIIGAKGFEKASANRRIQM